jgi:hypothetical protein
MRASVLSALRSAERRNRPRWRARHLPRTALAERYVNRLISDELERQLASVDPLTGASVWQALLAIHSSKICKLNLVKRSPR